MVNVIMILLMEDSRKTAGSRHDIPHNTTAEGYCQEPVLIKMTIQVEADFISLLRPIRMCVVSGLPSGCSDYYSCKVGSE